jgi:hypothetical protein
METTRVPVRLPESLGSFGEHHPAVSAEGSRGDMYHGLTIVFVAHLLVASASPSRAASPPSLLAGVIEIEPVSQCVALRAQTYFVGWYVLENYGNFVVGDTVTVVARDEATVTCGGRTFVYLPGNVIAPWRGFDFGCGTLLIDPVYGCETVFSDTYGAILLNGSTGLADGAKVRLRGRLFLQQCVPVSGCGGTYCATLMCVEACPPEPARSVTWGRLKSVYRQAGVAARRASP